MAQAGRLRAGGLARQSARVLLGVEVLAAYAQARHELKRRPIGLAVANLRRSRTRPGHGREAEARRLGSAVTRVLAVVPADSRCLLQSLVLTRMLARRGIEAKLVIAARSRPDFLAHAWVETDGRPVLDPGDDTFGRLVEL